MFFYIKSIREIKSSLIEGKQKASIPSVFPPQKKRIEKFWMKLFLTKNYDKGNDNKS